jgi:uncharacterized protein YndB with AHSA1/START domain
MSTVTMTEPVKGYELKITRVFDAPRELVWKAWTDPEMALHWMGPRGFAATEFVVPREVGKEWHMTMVGKVPASQQPAMLRQHGRTLEIDPPRKLVYTFAWDNRSCVGLRESPFTENIVTLLLEEKGNTTVMTFTQGPFATEGERDGHTGGWNSAFDKFAEFMLAEQPTRVEDPDFVPRELHIKRVFAAPRQLVFDAWTKPEMVAVWWGPKIFKTVVEKWDARPGGDIYAVMKGPGIEHPMSGRFIEVYPPHRFLFTAAALDKDGKPMFENWNSVFFEEVEGGTQVTLDVHVMSETEGAEFYLKGMSMGWNQSLDRLEELLKSRA